MVNSTNKHPYTYSGEKGPYINTYNGHTFHILNPESESIDIEDIAHHLSMQCRSVGAITRHYSVAQHSLFVCKLVTEGCSDKLTQLKALMHDSEEYITGDWPTPLKHCVPGIRTVARNIKRAIGEKFGIDLMDMPDIIKGMDNVAMATEKEQLYMPSNVVWHDLPVPDDRRIPVLNMENSEWLFIDKFMELAVHVIPNTKGEEWWHRLLKYHKPLN